MEMKNVFKWIVKYNKKSEKKVFGLKLYAFVLCSFLVFASDTDYVKAQTPVAKNIILMIADGWGAKQIEATNDYTNSSPTYQTSSSYKKFWMSTYPVGGSYNSFQAWSNFNYPTQAFTDSAAAASALYSGTKTDIGNISVSTGDANRLFAIGEKAKQLGKAVGAVSTVAVSHATPGAWTSHNDVRSNGYAIADEAFFGDPNTTGSASAPLYGGGHGSTFPIADVVIGSSGSAYINNAIFNKLKNESGQPGKHVFVERKTGVDGGTALLNEANKSTTKKLAGLFGGHIFHLADGSNFNSDRPTLSDSAIAALTVLNRDPSGFVLMVEGGAVDWGGHANNMDQVVGEMKDFNAAVQAVINWINNTSGINWSNTLLIVTGDHECGFLTPDTGVFPDLPLGTVNDTTIGIEKVYSGSGGRRASWNDADNDSVIDAGETVYWAWNTGNHSNSLIPLYTRGSGSNLFFNYDVNTDQKRGKYIDNTNVFDVMNSVLVNQAPNGTITSPGGNQVINVGQSINFTGTGSDPDNNTPLTYLWNFGSGSGIGNSTSKNAGSKTFNSAGVFTVTYTVKDSLGLADPTPDTVQITVQAVANQAPNGTITSPGGNQVINVGQSINFTGTGSDPDGDTPLTYLWNFGSGSGIGNSTSKNAGSKTFNSAGVFTVTYTVKDSKGLADPTPDTVQITVMPPGNLPPNGTITSPGGNQVINVGQSINFTGSGSDPDGDTPLTYLWNFGSGSGIGNSTSKNAGSKTFNSAGVFTVTYTVKDSKGLADPTPDTVQVTVNSGGGGAQFFDDFSSNTIADYSPVDVSWANRGPGSFIYDAAGQSAKVVSEDNVGILFSHSLPVLDTGSFSIDFLPTTKFPLGGWIEIRLIEDANNYYELSNSDGYGPFQMKKIVGGVEVENVPFTNGFVQNTNYAILIAFSPNLTTVNAFGNVLTLNTDNSNISVNKFEVVTKQQSACFDNILLNSTAPVLNISEPDGVGDTITVGDVYNITYDLSDTNDVVTAAFAYDTNNTGLDGTFISGACATAIEGTGVTCSWDTTGITPGTYYVYGITNDGSNPQVSAYSSGVITINAGGGGVQFSDDFSTNTIGDYSAVDVSWGNAGPALFVYDAAGQRAKVESEDNAGVLFSHSLPVLDTGSFSIDFLPTTKFPFGGWIEIRLIENANNYYELSNSDGYGPFQMKKIVGGVEVENVPFTNGFIQNTNYTIKIDFSPGLTTVTAFGNVLILDTDNSNISVDKFEIVTKQQDASYDNIVYQSN